MRAQDGAGFLSTTWEIPKLCTSLIVRVDSKTQTDPGLLVLAAPCFLCGALGNDAKNLLLSCKEKSVFAAPGSELQFVLNADWKKLSLEQYKYLMLKLIVCCSSNEPGWNLKQPLTVLQGCRDDLCDPQGHVDVALAF